MGRTSRTRKRRHLLTNMAEGISFLTRWMGSVHGWKPVTKLRIHSFPGTGRGLQSLGRLERGDVVVEVPSTCIITPELVELEEGIGALVRAEDVCVKLIVFLMCEWRKGGDSSWKPYLDTIPLGYENPGFLWDTERMKFDGGSLPEPFRSALAENAGKVDVSRAAVEDVLRRASLPFDRALFHRAWFSVNTRCVHMNGTWAMVPFLDLLNHSPRARTEVYVDGERSKFVLKTETPVRKGEQVFINYGPHGNVKLWIEYGFVCADNPFEYVDLAAEDVLDSVAKVLAAKKLLSDDEIVKKRRVPVQGPLSYYGEDGFSCAALQLVLDSLRVHSPSTLNDYAISQLSIEILEHTRATKIRLLEGTLCNFEKEKLHPSFRAPLNLMIETWVRILRTSS